MALRRCMAVPVVVAVSVLASLLGLASSAAASPGAYKVLLTEPYEAGPHALQQQIAAFPDFVSFDFRDTSLVTPSPAELAPYDAVVSVGDNTYLDAKAWGDSLATYLDQGQGVVVQFSYDSWENDPVAGRWLSGGYAPFLPGPNENFSSTLGAFDPADPLMQGVTAMSTKDNTTPTLASGARLVASWANGKPAIAVKGRAVSVASWAGDDYGPEVWSGDFGRLVVNAVRNLGGQGLAVSNANPAGGTITGSVGGISCGTTCSATLAAQTQVSLAATPNPGFAFAGYGGACSGTSCALTLAGGGTKTVSADFLAFGFGSKLQRNKKRGTATVAINVGAPGEVVLSGKKVKRRARTAAAAGQVKLTVAAKGPALKRLKKRGKARVKLNLAFTPTGGTTASLTKAVVLKRTKPS